MADTKPIPVRLDPDSIRRLDAVATRIGSNRSAMMKFLVKTFLDDFERGGITSLPHDWQTVMRNQDGRTFAQQELQSLRTAETPAGDSSAPAAKAKVTYLPKKTNRKPKP